MRGKIISFVCGVLITLLVVFCCLHFEKNDGLYDYARGLPDRDMFVCGDGSLWRLEEEAEDRAKLIFTGEYANKPIDLEVDKNSAADMSIDEFVIATMEDENVFIRKDGRVYTRLGYPEDTAAGQPVSVLHVSPEHYTEVLDGDLSINDVKIIRNNAGESMIALTAKNNGSAEYQGIRTILLAYVDGAWYKVEQRYSGTAEMKFLLPGDERLYGMPCRGGGYNALNLPSGRYRAELYNYINYNPVETKTLAAVEFELVCVNGEYSVK